MDAHIDHRWPLFQQHCSSGVRLFLLGLLSAVLLGTCPHAFASGHGDPSEDLFCEPETDDEPRTTAFFVIFQTENSAQVGKGGFRTREEAEAIVPWITEQTQRFYESVIQGEIAFEIFVAEASGPSSALLQVTLETPPPEILEQLLERDREELPLLGGLSCLRWDEFP